MASINVARVDHVAIAAADTDRLAQWYVGVLGFCIMMEVPPKPLQTHGTYLVGPESAGFEQGYMIEIMPCNGRPRHVRTNFDAGVSHLAFAVNDFDAALAGLRQANVQFLGEIVNAVGGGRLISFADPEGNMLQIVERP